MNRPAFYFLGFILMMLLATSAYASAVQLAWDPSTSSGVAGYRVYRSEQMGVYTSSPLNGSTPVTTTSWTDSSVTSAHTYYYVVRTVSTTSEESTNSNEVSVTISSSVPTTPFSAHINFQAAGATYPGYLPDVGAAFANRGNGFTYGWSRENSHVSTNMGPRTRGNSTSPDLRYDTLVYMGKLSWEIQVPNGMYTVHVVVGDPSFTDVVSKLTVEGTLTINGNTSSSARWLQGTATVSVNDGRLTISNLSGSDNKICFIDISSTTTTTTTQTASMGPPIADTIQPLSEVVSNRVSFPETTLPLIQNGRVYAEIQGSVNTAITMNNPNADAATVDFYFTDANGIEIYSNRMFIPANGQVTSLLSDSPFAPPPDIALGTARTFTFLASAPIAVTAARGFTNERSELLVTPLPIAELTSGAGFPLVFRYDMTGEVGDTKIQLVNPSNSVLSGIIRFFPAANPMSPALESFYKIAPRSSFTLRIADPGPVPRAGSIQVVPLNGTPTPSGLLILSLHEGDVTESETGILPSM